MKKLLSTFHLPPSIFLEKCALALFCYMPFHIFLSQWLSVYTGGLDGWKIAKDVFTALLTILCVVTVVCRRRATKFFWWLVGLAAAYTLLHMILLVATDQPHGTGLLATTYNVRIFCYVLIGYSLSLLMPKKNLAKNFARILVAVSAVVCLIGLMQWLLPKDIMTDFGYSIDRGVKPAFFIDDKPDLPRIMSTIRDPNSLGAFLILPITILAGALARGWSTNRRMLLSGLLLLHILALFLTFSRSAFLAAIISLAVMAGFTFQKHIKSVFKNKLVFLLVGISCMATLGGIYVLRDQYVVQNVVFHSDENTKLTDSNNLHVIQIQKGLDGVAAQPLGNGPGTAGLVSTHLQNGLLTENYYVQIAYEVGIFGLLIFLAFLFLILRALWVQKKDLVTIALLASFVGLAVMNLLLHTWANEAVTAAWFLLAGLALIPDKKGKERPKYA